MPAKALLADETATGSQLEKAKEELQAAYAELKVDKTALKASSLRQKKEISRTRRRNLLLH